MRKEQRAALVRARRKALKMSRELPMRQCSPYGRLDYDVDKIRAEMRAIYEAIFAVTTLAHSSTDRGGGK